MSNETETRTAQAGTVESMDCLVTIAATSGPRVIEITGDGAIAILVDKLTRKGADVEAEKAAAEKAAAAEDDEEEQP